MSKIDISTPKYPDTFAMVDDEDYDRINAHKWYASGIDSRSLVACRCSSRDGKRFTEHMHREVMRAGDGFDVDHIFHNKLDNRKSKLRVCTHSQNAKNRLISQNNTSGYKGVSFVNNGLPSPWLAQITSDGVQKHLGFYKTKEDAATAYDCGAIRLHGEFANLNDIDYSKQAQPDIDIDLYLATHQQKELLDYEDMDIILDVIGSLNERKREVVSLRFGVIDGTCHTLAEIGLEVKLSRERIRLILRDAILEIRNAIGVYETI